MTTKPSWIKWCNDDSAAKILDPGTSKQLGGFLYKEKMPFRFINWLFNRLWKWLLGLQGGYYDIVVGSSTQVTNKEATHVIGDLNDTLVVAGSRVLILDGTHTLGAALSLSNADLKVVAESPLAILDVATYTATFSGARAWLLLRVTNAGAGDVIVSGAGSIFEGIDLDIDNVVVSNGAVARTSGTANGLKYNNVDTTNIKPLSLDHGSKSGAFEIDLSLAEFHLVEFSAVATLTISSSKTNDKAVVCIKNGGNVITLSGIDNDSPTLTATASTQDFLGITKSFGKITCVSSNLAQPTT